MKNIQIQNKGIHNCKPDKKNDWFIQFASDENIIVPAEKPDIEEISSVIVDPEIISLRVVNTAKGISNEGQHLTGKKIVAEIKLRQKIMYVANTETQSVHVVENEYYQSAFIVIPTKICGTDPEVLLECNYLQAKILVENIFAEKIDKRNIAKIIHLLLKLHVVPTYRLCYTEDYNCTNSNLYIVHEDGTKKKQLTFFDDTKIYSPKWSPCGKKIAFISKNDKRHLIKLNIISISNSQVIELTDPYTFSFIGSYCWGQNSNIIYFSAFFKNSREIFEMNIPRLEWNQLTFSSSDTQNFKPKLSTDCKHIAYLKEIGESANLYYMNTDGLKNSKITNSCCIRDFDWSYDSSVIAYIDTDENTQNYLGNSNETYVISGDKKGNSIILFNIITGSKDILPINHLRLNIRKVLFSPNGRYLAFIGKKFNEENIYLFDLLKNDVTNLTNSDAFIEISDFSWGDESNVIYYGSNDLTYYNVYTIQINNRERMQISNTMADKILIDYRPKIR